MTNTCCIPWQEEFMKKSIEFADLERQLKKANAVIMIYADKDNYINRDYNDEGTYPITWLTDIGAKPAQEYLDKYNDTD